MYWHLVFTLLGLGLWPTAIEACNINLNGDSGKFSIDKTYLNRPANCSWTIGKDRSDIRFIVIKFEPFDLGDRCISNQQLYVEVADVNHKYKVRECGGTRSFEVLIKNRSAVVRYYSEVDYLNPWYCYWYWYWHVYCNQKIRFSFHVIPQNLTGLSAKTWKPTVKQSKPGEVTIGWDPSSLPSKNYSVVPLYNFTVTREPFLYIIEHRNETSIAVEYLKPDTSYTFKIFAFDSTNTTRPLIISTTWSGLMRNEKLRLIGGQLPNEGRVEVFNDTSWKTICADNWWDINAIRVVCRSLGLPSPPHYLYYGAFTRTSLPAHFLDGYRCNGTETNLEDCQRFGPQSFCQHYPNYQAELVCGHPPVFHENITEMTGVIKSPGYPSFMMQADYRWTFMPNLTRGRVVLYFDELDLQRHSPDRGYSSVYIQESGREYRSVLQNGAATVLTLPGQIKFYSSSSTRRLINRHYGKGMRARYFSYSEPVFTLKNWTISLSSLHYNRITARWTRVTVTGYDTVGFLISCNSTQHWANETFYKYGENTSISVSFNGLIGFTHYNVYVLVILKKHGDGVCTAYKSLMASITTPESYPMSSPQGVYSTDITSDSAVIGWKAIPRKETHGLLLGYSVQLYRYYVFVKEFKTKAISVTLTDLLPLNQYRVLIQGYTAVGEGPYAYHYFSTTCDVYVDGDSGEILINETYLSRPSNCSWTIGKGRSDINFIVIKFEPFDLGYYCNQYQELYVEIADLNHEYKVRECGGWRSFEVVIKNRSAVVRYYSEINYLNYWYGYCRWYSNWYWQRYCSQSVNVSFHVISQNLAAGLNAKSWEPTLKQSKPGVVTIDWDHSTLPSKNYIVVPLYNFTETREPFLHIIELRNDTSIAVEYLKPSTSYSFKVIAFDSTTNKTRPLIISTVWSVFMRNETLRLIGGQLSNEGRVEVFKNESWNTICAYYYYWRNININRVVCRSLGLPSPPHSLYYGTFTRTSFPAHFLEDYYWCSGTESNLEECSRSDTQSMCQRYPFYQEEVVCGHPPVFHQNITAMTGVITSPGYPSSMMQADYRWTFMPNLTNGRVVVYFDELDLRRQWPETGSSTVYINESGKVYRNSLYHGAIAVLSLSGQLQFFSSSSTRQIINRQHGKGMRARYFSYSEPVSTLKNWTLSLWSQSHDSITVGWNRATFPGYDILGFLVSCNSSQDWANKTHYEFGQSHSTSITLNGLMGYTKYDVHVLAMLRKENNGTFTAYQSSKASITTHESFPRSSPQEVYSTDITSNTAVIGWKQIPRKDAHGVLLGYLVKVYNYNTARYGKEINTTNTSVFLNELSPATEYQVQIRGYTLAGNGPYAYHHFSTKCNFYLNGDDGEFSINKTYLRKPFNCSWTIGKGKSDINFIIIKFEPFDLGDNCIRYQNVYIEVADIYQEFKVRECGGSRPFEVLIKNRSVVVKYYSEIYHLPWYCQYYWYEHWSCRQNIRFSFHIISQKLTASNAESWTPALKQSKPGEVTIEWDRSSLPSKNYIVVPLYNFTVTREPYQYIIEHRNDTSIAVEYLKPATSYSFKVIAFDYTNKTSSFESTTFSLIMKNGTVRLKGGQLPNEGRVEVFQNGFWNKICAYHYSLVGNYYWWDIKDANVVCRSLDLPSPSLVMSHRTFMGTSFPVHFLEDPYHCNGTETTFGECSSIDDTHSLCQQHSMYQAAVVCGRPPVSHQNITAMTGVITSPGYPSSMMQADYRWTIMPNLTRGRVVLVFDELDFRRQRHDDGYSSVSIQESGKVYRNGLYHGVATVLGLPGQLNFYSSFSTPRVFNAQYGKGMRARYFSYSEPVFTVKNWTLSLSSYNYDQITANWAQINVTNFGIYGYLLFCNSTQPWVNETIYRFGESNSRSLTCNGLIGYTNYDVHVLVLLKKGRNGSCTAYLSSKASKTTPESFPSIGPQGIHSTSITSTTAVIGWQPLRRSDTHGILLGYRFRVYNYNTYSYGKEIKTNDTSVILTDLSPVTYYEVMIRGYTAAGTGPYAYHYFLTICGGTIKNQLHGKIHLRDFNRWYTSCMWKLVAPTQNTLILFVLESLYLPLSFGCSDFYLTIKDGQGNSAQGRMCGSRHSLSFISFGNTEVKLYLTRPGRSAYMSSSFFMLENGLANIPSIKPWNISSSTNSSTSINVSWDKYPGNESVSKYVVICTANNHHRNVSAASTDVQSLNAVVQNMLKNTEYRVVVVAMLVNSSLVNLTGVNGTISKSQEVVIKTAEDVPSRPPQNIIARYLGSKTLAVSWNPVDNAFTNGIVVGYYVYYQVAWTGLNSWKKKYIKDNKTKAYLNDLKDVTLYRIEVSAATKIGEGPRSRGIFIKTGCQIALSDRCGIFASPNYPSNYPSNANCTWIVSPRSSTTEMVVMFEHFDIEEGHSGVCSNDFVKVFDVPGKMSSSAVCGLKRPFAVVSAPRTIIILLKSDGGIEKRGFQAAYFLLRDKDKVIQLKLNSKNATATSLSWSSPSSSSIDRFYVLYKQDEVSENWKVVKTEALAVSISGLLPSTPYIAKVIGNSSEAAYWSNPVEFITAYLPTTPHPETEPTTEPTESVKLMYSYGTSEGDLTIPNTWEYRHRCFKITFNDDGFLFMTKRHYQIYVCRNGVMRFGSSSYLHWPSNFGTSSKYCDIDILAPYWSLADRQQSQVFYHVYSTLDNNIKTNKIIDQASNDVRLLKQNSLPSTFKASWVLVVTWDKLRHSTINAHTKNLTNTFQAVLITDGVYSYAMYNYPANGIEWSAPTSRQNWELFADDRGLPVIGLNAAGCIMKNGIKTPLNYFSDERSGTVNIGDIDNLKGNCVYRSRGQMKSNQIDIKGKLFFELFMEWAVSRGERECKRWFKRQPDPRPFLEYLEPCPCTSRQAWFDERFTPLPGLHWWSNPRPCALSTFPSIDGWEQKCCYSHESGQWGALLVGHPNGGYSHRYSKTKQSGSHINSDVMGYKYCCVDSNLCHLFYQRRPSDDCSRYEPPEWSWMWGDPHFVTLDGKNYTFNGLGEYVMLDAKNGFFQLQSRTRLAKGEGTATIFCAAVMKEYNCSTVQLNLAENGSMSVLIDGELLDLKIVQNGSTALNGSVVVARPQNNSFKATYPSGISVTLTESKGALSILVALPKSFRNKTKGLLGTWNGNKFDDFTTPSERVLPDDATSREIHFEFGQKWQVNETSSLFTYNVNESVSTFSNTSFVPMFVDELKFANKTLEKQAMAECKGDINCLFDAASTNDISVGLDTKVVGSQLVNDSATLSNSPPKFPNYTSAILLTINVTKHLQIPVEDNDGDSITFNVTGLPKGAIVTTNSSTVSVSWDVSIEKVSLEVIATDDKGAVSVLRPLFYLCACHNGAECIKPRDGIQSQSDNHFTILPCDCKGGYAGQYCEYDIDACKVNLNPCYPGVECKDLPAPANESGYECGPCPSGFSGKGDSCEDIDECRDGSNHGCSQICYNNPGSFVCGCKNGYTLKNDGSTCEDVNECQPLADCMQKCENTPGSYQCSCHNDFKEDPSDPKKCIPKFPCKDGDHGCQDICFESNNVANCACRMGYQLQSDKKSCADIDECKAGQDRCNQLCYNNGGGYYCTCLKGFRLSADNVTCVDINECLEWTFNCSASLRCENTIGSYNCRCQKGLYWIDNRCRELTTGEKKPAPKPPPKPPTPSKEDLRNSVNVTIKELDTAEWNLQLDLDFKKGVAREVTTFCAKNSCLQQNGRKRRSNSYITFTSNHVNLVGFPKQLFNARSGSMDALVVFYVKFPSGVASDLGDSLDGDILVDIINGSLGNIGKDIGKTLLSVSRYTVQIQSTTASPETTSSGHVTEKSNSLAYIIGGSVGGAIMVIILVVVIISCCKRRTAKKAPKEEKIISVEMNQYQQPSFIFENPNREFNM